MGERMSLFGVIRDANTGITAGVNSSNQLLVEIPPLISTNNSTSTPLVGDGTFYGTADEINGYGIIYINVYSDVASAADGLKIFQSPDGISWNHCDEYTIPAATGKNFSINPYAKYIKIEYDNGATPQSEFQLQTIYKADGLASSHRIQDAISSDDDADLVKAVLTGKDPNGIFQNVNTTEDGDLTISDNSSGLAIAQGKVTGTSFIHKFGFSPDFDQADGFATVWDGSNDADIAEMEYTYSTSNAIDSISSTDTGDTQDIEIQGLYDDGAGNWLISNQTVTLTGQARVAIPQPLIRVFRMVNVNSTDIAGFVYSYENTALSAGRPVDTTKIRAVIENGNNQTLMAIYTIPSGKTGYMRDWYASTAGANRATNYLIDLRARPMGGVFQVKHRSALDIGGTTYIQHKYEEPEVFGAKTDVEMRCKLTASGVTGAAVSSGFDIVLVDN
jgi:hypothetical protein